MTSRGEYYERVIEEKTALMLDQCRKEFLNVIDEWLNCSDVIVISENIYIVHNNIYELVIRPTPAIRDEEYIIAVSQCLDRSVQLIHPTADCPYIILFDERTFLAVQKQKRELGHEEPRRFHPNMVGEYNYSDLPNDETRDHIDVSRMLNTSQLLEGGAAAPPVDKYREILVQYINAVKIVVQGINAIMQEDNINISELINKTGASPTVPTSEVPKPAPKSSWRFW